MPFSTYKWYLFGFSVFLNLCSLGPAVAQPIDFVGGDNAMSLATMPNSVAASNDWNLAAGALGTIRLIDFESPYPPSTPALPYLNPSNTYTSLLLAPGVTLSTNVGLFAISNDVPTHPNGAFNTTPGGAFYAGLRNCPSIFGGSCSAVGSVYTFSFDTPIQAFGLYITGRGQGAFNAVKFSYDDPVPQTTQLRTPDGNVFQGFLSGQFGGFTDAGATISSVTVTLDASSYPNLADAFALDDVRWVSSVRSGATPSNPILSTPGSAVFNFENTPVQRRVLTYYDPIVSIGYDYESQNELNFQSVLIPNAYGNGLFDLFWFDGSNYVDSLVDLTAGVELDFATLGFADGVSRFGIRGIEVSANVDPTDLQGFVTGLSFSADGIASFLMTPVTFNTDEPATPTPEPATLLVLSLGAAGLAIARRRGRGDVEQVPVVWTPRGCARTKFDPASIFPSIR